MTVQDNDDLTIGRSKIARCIGKRLSASRIERDVDRVVLAGFRCLVYRNARDVFTRDEGRIGTRINAAIRCLARLEGIAEIVGNRTLLHVGAVLDGSLIVSFGEGISASKFQLARFADGSKGCFGIGKTRDLDQDLIVALNLNRCLRCAQGIDARFDDGARLLHVFLGNVFAIGALRRKDHRETALDVKTLIDLFVRGREHEHRAEYQNGCRNKKPYVTAVLVATRTLVALLLALGILLLGFLRASLAALFALLGTLLFFSRKLLRFLGRCRGFFFLVQFVFLGLVDHSSPSDYPLNSARARMCISET